MLVALSLVISVGLTGWVAVARRRTPLQPVSLSVWRAVLLAATGVPLAAVSAVTALFVITYMFQFARIDGEAMAPTLPNQTRVPVNKLACRTAPPRPGDIAMLRHPVNPDKLFAKRIIAKAGDSVRIVNGHVFVNDQPLKDDYVSEAFRSHDDWGPVR